MRTSSSVTLAAIVFSGVFGCSASSDSGGGGSTDGGTDTSGTRPDSTTPTDTRPGDSTTPTDSTTPSDTTTPTDSSTPSDTPSDAPGDTGGKTCDPFPGDECNMVAQTGCTAEEMCDYVPAKGHKACVKPTNVGVVGKGETCNPTTNPCEKGLHCIDGKCTPTCCPGDDSICGKDGACNLIISDDTDKALYHVCTYPAPCKPFKYDCPTDQVCLFDSEPDSFACATPTATAIYSAAPGKTCKYANDCGESQVCTRLSSSSGDAGTGSSCYLFCYLTGPEAGSVGTDPKGRFPANGTCTVGGKTYGTCQAITGIGGGLGLCVP
jgi:hypothetical protein